MTEWIIPLLCGFGAGVLSAWGVGGGTLLLLVMTLFLGVEQRAAQGINLLFFLPTAASALSCHWRSGFLDKPTLKSAVPAAILAALAGAWIATAVDAELQRLEKTFIPTTPELTALSIHHSGRTTSRGSRPSAASDGVTARPVRADTGTNAAGYSAPVGSAAAAR